MRIKKISQVSGIVGSVLNNKNNSTNDTYSCDYQDKAFGGTILWTNSSPTTEMPQNTLLTLNNGDYDIYEIIFFPYGGSSQLLSSYKSVKGIGVQLSSGGYPSQGISAWSRGVDYINETTLRLQDCFGLSKDSDFTDNTKCIPLYVIGYKLGLFNTSTQASDNPTI